MKYKLPILTVALVSGLLATCWLLRPFDFELPSLVLPGKRVGSPLRAPHQGADLQVVEDQPPAGEATVGPQAAQSIDGQRLVQRALKEILNQESLQADMRQQVDLYGHHLLGVGRYRQFFVAGQRYLKLELKLQVGHQGSSLTQVSDGRHLWTRLDMPEESSLSRIDLRRVQEAVGQQSSTDSLTQSSMFMALGGLPKLLQGLESHFEFSRPQAAQWQNKPVWVTEGTWKPTLVKHHWGSLKSKPEYVPGRVQLVLARDSTIRLFPYRIRFWQAAHGVQEDPASSKPMLTMEFHRVTRPAFFSVSMFEYERGDQVVIDRTDIFLEHLRNPPWSFANKVSP